MVEKTIYPQPRLQTPAGRADTGHPSVRVPGWMSNPARLGPFRSPYRRRSRRARHGVESRPIPNRNLRLSRAHAERFGPVLNVDAQV